jgi:1-acyl-sn-glycerol-3-phosphate acyltransferase
MKKQFRRIGATSAHSRLARRVERVINSILCGWCGLIVALFLHLFVNLDLASEGPGAPGSNGLIMVCNHRSKLDLYIALAVFRRWKITPRMLVHTRYFERPGVGLLLRGIGAIPASQETARATMRAAIDALATGECVALAPEGRVVHAVDRAGGISSLRRGAARFAVELGTPIFVVGLSKTDRAWPPGSRLPSIRLRKALRPTVKIEAVSLAVEQGAPVAAVMADLRKTLLDVIVRAESP